MDVVVVGAGVSGLSTAYTLKKKKAPETSVLVTEARDRVGGNIQSKSDGTYVWEEGPNSFLLYTSPSPRHRQKSRMPYSA